MKKTLKSGFSLIEIVVALAVIVILVGVIAPSVTRQIDKAKVDSVVEDFRAIELAITQYYADVGNLSPLNDIGGFTANPAQPTVRHFLAGDGQPNWDGPYLQSIKINSTFGGIYDIDVISSREATIDLGSQAQLGANYQVVLEALNDSLDGDGDLTRGTVWGDANGVHFGYNYYRP
ncbi:MAG: prepilin-type N-terminal cleavage/methylation domain-containing protein [Planctomycetota bacterium]